MTDTVSRLQSSLADRYRIERELGAGGMATVYLAQDLKHDRQVALKLLRPELSAILGAERFLQEIKVTANLQHSHILPLYDSGSADGLLFYVMPYVEGDSLRDRLEREKQLPVDEAVRLAVQVASALEYAHKRGVIHRDIKPENILLREGDALVADFGIALAVRNAGGNRMTETGLSLGTPQYMSPEQATADRELNARSDVYSLGCVLYEMLSGEPPHTGPTAQAIIARLMTEDPRRVTSSRPTVPPHVEAALHTALQRLPADRFGSAAHFADALSHAGALGTGAYRGTAGALLATPAARRPRWLIPVAAVGTLTALIAWNALRPKSAPVAETSRRLTIVLPDSAPLWFYAPSYYGEGKPGFALSPDGRRLVYVARVRGTSQLMVRPLDRDTIWSLPGTIGASLPTFSPDGEWVAFFADGALHKVALADGRVVRLAAASAPASAVWRAADRIIYSSRVRSFEVSSGGGTPVRLADSAGIDIARMGPGPWLIGQRTSLYPRLSVWDPATGEGRRLAAFEGDTAGIPGVTPLWSASGHVLFVQDSTLMALPFDGGSMRATGPMAPVLLGVRHEAWGEAQVALSSEGTLAYARGVHAGLGVLIWAAPDGRVVDTLPVPRGEHTDFSVAPDGRHVWVLTQSAGKVVATAVNTRTGLSRTFPGENYATATWGLDGTSIILNQNRTAVAVPLTGAPRVDTLVGSGWQVSSLARDGGWYAATGPRPDSLGVWLIGRGANSGQRLRVGTAGFWSNFSPDSRWLALLGPDGLYVSPLPSTGELIKVSPPGADEPEWSPRGDRLYYRAGSKWYAIPVSARGTTWQSGDPVLLFDRRFLQANKSWDVGPDGRFLVYQGPPEESTTRIEIITNVFAELRRLAPSR